METIFNLEKLKFPIGEFQKPNFISENDLKTWIATIEDFPSKIKKLTSTLSSEELNWIYRPQGWNIKQVVHHCADSHMNSFIRFKLALTEEVPTIKPYEEQLWAELVDGNSNDLTASIQIIEGVHARWVLLLKSFGEKELKRQFIHPANKKTSCLDEVIGIYAWHCDHHLAHIEQALFYKGQFLESTKASKKREILKIGKREFKFKKDALLHYKNILNSYRFDELLNEEDFNDILNLLKFDHSFETEKYRRLGQKIYASIEYSKIRSVKISKVQFNTKCFELIFDNLSTKQISYTYIINRPIITADSTFNIACRNTIIKDMNLVKRKYFETHSIKGQVKCQETKELSNWEDLVVDHRQPNTFSIIVDRFKEVTKIDLEIIEYLTDDNNFLLFKDEELTEQFRNYHKEKATLRVVKKECNSSRTGMAKIKKNTKDLSIE